MPDTLDAVATTGNTSSVELIIQGATFGANDSDSCVYVGKQAGSGNLGTNVSAFGLGAANANEGDFILALGQNSAQLNEGSYVVSAGLNAAYQNTGSYVNAIGNGAASANVGTGVVSIGTNTAERNLGSNIVGIGDGALQDNTKHNVVAIGGGAGQNNIYDSVRLFGSGATATGDNQTVFSDTENTIILHHVLLGSSQKKILKLTIGGESCLIQLDKQSGTYAQMLSVPSPFTGMYFYTTDHLIGKWEYSEVSSKWEYQPSHDVVQFKQTFPCGFAQHQYAWFQRSSSGLGAFGDRAYEYSGHTRSGTFLYLITGSTSTGQASLHPTGTGLLGSATKVMAVHMRTRVVTLSTSTERFIAKIGMAVSNAGAMFYYDEGVKGGNWWAVTTTNFNAAGNTQTNMTDTGVAVDNNFHDFVYLVDMGAGNAKFYIDGNLVATVSTSMANWSSLATNAVFSGINITKQIGTTLRELDIEEVSGFVYKR